MNKEEIKLYVEQVFSGNAVPENYTNRDHCDECAEHDETLRSYTPKSIGLEQLGNAGWDPICFVLPKAFKYYFPALVRLSLDSEGANGYLDQFLFHVTYQGEDSRFFKHFSNAERGATLEVLQYIESNMDDLVHEWNLENELKEAIGLWSKLVMNS
jgi:hypothetical protein